MRNVWETMKIDISDNTNYWAVLLFLFGLIVRQTPVPADEPRPVEFARFEAYCEGPVFDDAGNLFVSHGKSLVSKIDRHGRVRQWLKADNPNGHKILSDGTHLLCVKGAILHLDQDGCIIRKVSTECNGAPLRAPNDITLAKNGFLLHRPWWIAFGTHWDSSFC